MISLTTAQNALKTVYLEAMSNELNTQTDPIFATIKQSTADVYGRNIIKLVPYGINGGIGTGTETGALPASRESHYVNFATDLKNLFGTIEISDKAIRASASNEGAFVNLLSAEMDSLLESSKFNLARMFYGDNSGSLSAISSINNGAKTFTVANSAPFVEGMLLDFYLNDGLDSNMTGVEVVAVNHNTKVITLSAVSTSFTSANVANYKVFVQGSKDRELTGLGALFGTSDTLYGISRENYKGLMPIKKTQTESTLTETFIQECLDAIEIASGYQPKVMVAASDAYYALIKLILSYSKNIDSTNLVCGVSSVGFNGVPLTRNKFVNSKQVMALNPELFTLHQLCDWEWLTNNDGSILRQKEGYPTYSATLVKYADLVCNRPNAQGLITIL